jgi:hypothetical protein
MKKVAIILAIAFVFLVGEKIVFEHKVWAGEKKTVAKFKIPVSEDGKFIVGDTEDKDKIRWEPVGPPIDVRALSMKNIQSIETAIIIRYEDDPGCYIACSGGSCFKRCF